MIRMVTFMMSPVSMLLRRSMMSASIATGVLVWVVIKAMTVGYTTLCLVIVCAVAPVDVNAENSQKETHKKVSNITHVQAPER